MSLIAGIVERELRYLSEVEAKSRSERSIYLEIAHAMGVYGSQSVRFTLLRAWLQDLYQYFCHLYDVPCDRDLVPHPVGLIDNAQRRRFTANLLAYWQSLDDCTPASVDLTLRVRDLQILTEALSLIEDDPMIEFPQRPFDPTYTFTDLRV